MQKSYQTPNKGLGFSNMELNNQNSQQNNNQGCGKCNQNNYQENKNQSQQKKVSQNIKLGYGYSQTNKNQRISDQVNQSYKDQQYNQKNKYNLQNQNLEQNKLNKKQNFKQINEWKIKNTPQNNSNVDNKFIANQFKVYKIISGMNNRFLLDSSQSRFGHNKAIIYENNNEANQKFILKQIFDNKYIIFCAKNGLALQVENNLNGTRLAFKESQGTENQFCELVPVDRFDFQGKNAFYIKIMGKNIDVQGAICKKQSNVILFNHNGNNNQVWVIQQTL